MTSFVCHTEGHGVTWSVQYLDESVCDVVGPVESGRRGSSSRISPSTGCHNARYATAVRNVIVVDVNGNRRQIQIAQLTVNDTRLEDAGTYSCIYREDRNQRGHATLAVLGITRRNLAVL